MKKEKITLQEFQSIVDDHATLEQEIKELEAKRDRGINILLTRYNSQIEDKKKEKKSLYKKAKSYALKHRKDLFADDSKTAETNLASYSFRLSPETLKTQKNWTWDRVKELLRKHKKFAFLIIKEDVNKAVIKSTMKAAELDEFGMKLVQEEEFAITPKTKEL
ncbi:MAG: host-nuclease inhibitor Gam family protein [Akkermansia sp.]